MGTIVWMCVSIILLIPKPAVRIHWIMSESDLREGQPGAPPDSPVEKLPTHQAAAGNDVARLSELVEEGSPLEGPESRDTPLHAAAKRGALDTLRWMLDNETVSPLKKAGNGNTAAHYAAVYGHLEALKVHTYTALKDYFNF